MDRVGFSSELTFDTFKSLGYDIIIPLCLGSLIFAVLWGLLSYALTIRFIPILRTIRLSRWPRPFKRRAIKNHAQDRVG